MIDLDSCNEWQHRCPETGLVLPWYTKSFLDELVTWDLSDKVVFEYGCGASTLWWREKCNRLCGVESNHEYYLAVQGSFEEIAELIHENRPVFYPLTIKCFGIKFDILVIDGIEREQCVPIALEYLKPGGILIYDNWMQPSVEVQSEETQDLLLSLPHKIYKQEGHPDWQTAVFTKPQ